MLQVGNIFAWICVDGVELTQYSVEDNGSEATCWIASEAGKNFSVHWRAQSARCPTRAVVSVDGQKCDSLFMHSTHDTYASRIRDYCVDAVLTSGTSERLLMFSPTNVTDDDEYLATTNQRAGEIKLQIQECEITGEATFKPSSFTGSQKVHEKSRKALVHQVGLGQERKSKKEWKRGLYAAVTADVASFVFHYRPIDFLRANGTAPSVPVLANTPSSSKKRPAQTDPEITTTGDSEGDLRALQKIESQLPAVREQLRNKRRRIQVKSEPSVKLEPGLVKREVIDLT
ncbi:hypothetical protein VKT23_002655 [Stygiomarasmius scandens]|uniref:DUF7918 domain-containing protein n=1 Tax=Marasmiellus scandens TaxID=2682957 RepID=A0ABR1K318_9AGAR